MIIDNKVEKYLTGKSFIAESIRQFGIEIKRLYSSDASLDIKEIKGKCLCHNSIGGIKEYGILQFYVNKRGHITSVFLLKLDKDANITQEPQRISTNEKPRIDTKCQFVVSFFYALKALRRKELQNRSVHFPSFRANM